MTTCRENRRARYEKSVNVVNPTISVYHATLWIVRHSGRAHSMRHVYDDTIFRPIVHNPRLQNRFGKPGLAKRVSHKVSKSNDGPTFIVLDPPLCLRHWNTQAIEIVGQSDAAFPIGLLFG